MAEKCPLCGAPMEGDGCGYCNYKDKKISVQNNPETGSLQEEIPYLHVNQNILRGVSRKNKIVALLLAIFLGYFGAHRFYVGKGGTGIIYLFTGGIFGIGWFIDIIMIAIGSFKDEFGLPLK